MIPPRIDSALADDIKVASVNKGVVLLCGKTPSLDQKLERVYSVDGVQRVASEIRIRKSN